MIGKAAVRVLFYGLIFSAAVIAIGYTLTPYGWLEDRFRYFSPGVDFAGGDKNGESPRIVVVHVSNDVIQLNGKEVFHPPADTDGRRIIFEDLKREIALVGNTGERPSGLTLCSDPENDPVIIRCDDDVRFSLLIRVLCTFWAADYEKVFLATPPADENRIEVLPVFRPCRIEWVSDLWFPDYINVPIEVFEKVPYVYLSDKGFYVGIAVGISDLVPMKGRQYGVGLLKTVLSLITDEDAEHVFVVSEPGITYEDIIAVIVACTDAGLSKIALTEHSMDLDKLCRGGNVFQYSYSRNTPAGLE